MNKTSNLNKVVDIIFGIALITTLLLFTNGSLLLFATCPILLAVIYFTQESKAYVTVLLGAILMGLFFTDAKSLAYNAIPLIIISLLFIIVIALNLDDKKALVIGTIITSIVAIVAYRISMVNEGLTISSMAVELKEAMEIGTTYEIDLQTYEKALALWPGILVGLSIVYNIFSLKIIKNYLAYKDIGSDMRSLNSIRITKNDAIIILIAALIIYLMMTFLFVERTYVLSNIIWVLGVIFALNGLAVYDYMLASSRTPIIRGLQWFFIIVFISFFAILFVMLGIVDVFLDIRSKVRRPDANK